LRIGFATAPLQKFFLMPLQKGTAWALQKEPKTSLALYTGQLTSPLLILIGKKAFLCPCKRALGPAKGFLNPHWELTAPLLLQAAKKWLGNGALEIASDMKSMQLENHKSALRTNKVLLSKPTGFYCLNQQGFVV